MYHGGDRAEDYAVRGDLQFITLSGGSREIAEEKDVMVSMYAPPFITHGFSMNQRLIVLKTEEHTLVPRLERSGHGDDAAVRAVAPPRYYMMFAVCRGVPSKAVWVKLQ